VGSSIASYAAADQERWVQEPPKSPGRSAFARDRARVLHSAALRRLAAKTQVVLPYESDFPRTRLTHSMEVGQVGRELGQALGCDPDLVEAACLAHDLGHPPFGHNGEIALAELAEPCGGFEGNAQSLRILTRLEAKAFAGDGRSVGLNLTRAGLDAATKYPWPRQAGRQKYGVYADDLEVFEWLREGAPGEERCVEAQVMDWSDDVAYSVHDLEDALHAGHLVVAALRSGPERAHLIALCLDRYATGDEPAAVEAALDRLLAEPWWPSTYDGTQRAVAGLKDLTSQLIGRFCSAAEQATRQTYGPAPLARYAADLVVPDETRLECAVLKAVTAVYVMERAGAPETYSRQRELVKELTSAVLLGAPGTLDPVHAPAFVDAPDDGDRLRVVVDQVASLTDPSAIAWHRKLTR
jgi:dGTPase